MQAINGRTIVIYLMGGFGNILFQINFACNLRDAGYLIRLNTYALKRGNIISRLLGWSNHNSLDDVIDLGILNNFETEHGFSFAFINALLSSKTNKSIFGTRFYGINSPKINEIINIKNLFGYFHNNNDVNAFFINLLRQRLDYWLSLKPELQEMINAFFHQDHVVVHVRGGDFTINSDLELGVEYYQNAVEVVQTKTGLVHVLTNDILYAKKTLKDIKFKIISQDSSIADFIILMKAKNKVLANSTFSWWAAELGDNNSRIVEVDLYYPKRDWLPRSMKQRIRIGRTIN
jgi:hypothetical protein